MLQAALPLLNVGARVPLCGLIAWYDGQNVAPGPDRTPALLSTMLVRQIKAQGFVIIDHYERYYGEFLEQMGPWLAQGKVRYTEHRVEGLEQSPQAFIALLRGDNFGKVVVHVSD